MKLAALFLGLTLAVTGCNTSSEVLPEAAAVVAAPRIESTFIPAPTSTNVEPDLRTTAEPATPERGDLAPAHATPVEAEAEAGAKVTNETEAIPTPIPPAPVAPTPVPPTLVPTPWNASPLSLIEAALRRDAAGMDYCAVTRMLEERTESIDGTTRSEPEQLEIEARTSLAIQRLLVERAPAEIAHVRQRALEEEQKLVTHGELHGWRIDEMLATWAWQQQSDRAQVDEAIGSYDRRNCGSSALYRSSAAPTPTAEPESSVLLSDRLFGLGLGQASVNCIVESVGGNGPADQFLPLRQLPLKCRNLIEFESG